jgi:hypothetical protein
VRLQRAQLCEVLTHLNCEGFPVVWDVFPTLYLVDDPMNCGCEGFVSLLQLVWITRVGASAEFSDATDVFVDSRSFNGAAGNGVSGSQMDRIKG